LRIGFVAAMGLLDDLLGSLRTCLEAFPDGRRGANGQYSMADFGLSAFSVFFMQSPSFLAHQRRLEEGHGQSNCQSLFGLGKIPSDNRIRDMLDPASPELLNPVFFELTSRLKLEKGGLDVFRRLESHVLIALDGTEYFCSREINCPNCLTRRRGTAGTEYYHAMLGATLVAPGHDKVIPLPPEFIAPQDGTDKQDCENAAAKRWLATHGSRYAALKPVYPGDDLFSRQPLCEAVKAAGGDFIFVCKPSSHPLIQEYVAGAEPSSCERTVRRGKKRILHRYRWLCGVPLRDGKDALSADWFEIEIADAAGKITYRNSFITNLDVTPGNVAELADCGRARWKIENETFNVLKTKGYHLEHNFGHGKKNLSAVLVALNLLAFAMHTMCEIADGLWRLARQKHGSRSQFFNTIAAVTAFLLFASWEDFLQTIAFVKAPPAPP
jgi:hypothetical protein